jgi:hypothetical protein
MDWDLIPDARLPWAALEWDKDPPPAEWDHALAALSGHPLQSCLWGDARHTVDGIVQHRWLARCNGEPVWMIRAEERKVPGGKIAWAPRGPTGRTADMSLSVPPGFDERLRAEGFVLLICDPWVEDPETAQRHAKAARTKPQTIWIDLSAGKDAVFGNLHKHVRNGVRRAAKIGVNVETTCDPDRIGEFVDLCSSISARKGFELRATSDFVHTLLKDSRNNGDAEAVLFVALKGGKLGAGLIALRIGQSVHMIFAGTDRDMRQERVGEACQWGVMEWAITRGCTRYDLEGIDPANNASVYEFKKRLGGDEITLHGHVHVPLNLFGRAISGLIRFGAKG